MTDAAGAGVRFGVRIAPRDASAAALAACVAHAQRAEALGLDWLGVAERFDLAGGVPDALSVCAAFGAATERVRIATAALPLPLHHPLRVAESAATIDSLSAGRLELGVGLGAAETPFGSFGLEAEERAERFTEAIAILRSAWGAEAVSFRGKHFACENVSVYPKPQQPGGPPLWLAASAPAALRRAAQLGVGVMLPAHADASAYLEACARAHEPARVVLIAGPERSREQLEAALERCAAASERVCLLDVASAAALERAAELAARMR
ncbi:MAG TPA: LLM class flavin-dependent oxidoreductase [Myxococcota bacterium]|jgi:alkanesulfonate monooxygenase SsuD/methylene tetrahydromethanopterin reductase-like flavin-dependent oxidoreductase (luciferase family)